MVADKAETEFGQRKGLIIAGPTASGKSAIAIAMAKKYGGTIINADSMQCYQELRVITARPSVQDEASVPHRLYGVRAAKGPANAAWWCTQAKAAMEAAAFPILCGGTGMYLSSLVQGIAAIPDPGEAARAQARAFVAQHGAQAAHGLLDDATAAKLNLQDSQRITRAYEVLLGTGQGLAHWQAQPRIGLQGWHLRMILLDPPRPLLREAIATRFSAMLAQGALEEVAALLEQNLPPDVPLLRALGVPELAAYLRGEVSLEAAQKRAVLTSFQYTKRQMTWFRHQALVAAPDLTIFHQKPDNLDDYWP